MQALLTIIEHIFEKRQPGGRVGVEFVFGPSLPAAGDPETAASILLAALHGGLLARASGAPDAPNSPDASIDYLLELWT